MDMARHTPLLDGRLPTVRTPHPLGGHGGLRGGAMTVRLRPRAAPRTIAVPPGQLGHPRPFSAPCGTTLLRTVWHHDRDTPPGGPAVLAPAFDDER
ncbi:hypothetical protein Stsp01_23460 [Streptomyces sp. NBRC 13847]|nr:hypothetical protein Stsp01_23460 [Streptomyces sp. NBRC 13847]